MTQNQQILEHFKTGKSLTPIQALNLFGTFRLGARVYDLRNDGHKIETEYLTVAGKTFAQYHYKGEA